MKDEERYPSIDLAYEFVGPSYQWLIGRWDSVNSRIQQMQGLAATVTLAAPVLVKAAFPGIPHDTPWFYWALVVFGLILVIGVVGRLWGTLKLASPAILYNEYLHLREWEFKKDLLWSAADAFEANHKTINIRAWFAIAMTVLFGVEIGLFVGWVVTLA